jgi:hypothetical protein
MLRESIMSNELAKQFMEIMFADESADIDAWLYAMKQKPEMMKWAASVMTTPTKENDDV